MRKICVHAEPQYIVDLTMLVTKCVAVAPFLLPIKICVNTQEITL